MRLLNFIMETNSGCNIQSTNSEYLERSAGNTFIKIRCSDHAHGSIRLRKPINVGIDLFKMTDKTNDAQETYAVAKRIIDNYL